MGLIDAIGGKVLSVLGDFDGGVFSQSLVLRTADQKVKKFFEPIGPVRLAWMIEHGESLESCLTPEEKQSLKNGAGQYADIAAKITDKQIVYSLPQWALDVIAAHGHQGNVWMKEQLKTIRSYFGG